MSLFNRQNSSVDKPRDTYRPLLWENILRNYQCQPHKSQQHRSDLVKPNIVKRSSDELPRMVDLSKKVKIKKLRSAQQQLNKQNMQDNGNTYYDESSSGRSQHSDILNNFDNDKMDKNAKYLDIQQFMCEEKSQQQQTQPKIQQNIIALQDKNTPHQRIEYEQNVFILNQNQIQIQRINEIDDNDLKDLPQIIQPIKEISRCEIMPQRKCSMLSEIYPQDKIVEQQNKNHEQQIDNQIKDIGNQQNNEKQTNQVEIINNQQKIQELPQIKTKLSLRILKKKLQKYSVEEVAEYVADHRRLVFDGYTSQPKKKTICQAIVSYIKHQLIG